MDPLRVQKTQLHREIGIFVYSRLLDDRGIRGPARQIRMIGRFLVAYVGPSRDLPPASDTMALEAWMGRGLDAVARDYVEEPRRCTLATLAVRALPFVAWDPYPDFCELLNFSCGSDAYAQAAVRLRRRGFVLSEDALWDLVAEFLPRYLRLAVKSFDCSRGQEREGAWLANVFFRFALKTLVADRANREHLETLGQGFEPVEVVFESRDEAKLMAVSRALGDVPPRLRQAVELYFGFRGKPQTLRQIGANLDLSEHLARAAVVRGLAAVASRVGPGGVLGPQELEMARLVFLEGMSSQKAAAEMEISPRAARTLVAGIGRKLRSGLRARTSRPVPRPIPTEKEDTMSSLTEDEVFAELQQLKEAPLMNYDSSGRAFVELRQVRVPLVRVHAILGDRERAEALQGLGIDLDWARPDLVRADLEPDAGAWQEALDQLAHRHWQVVERLYELCRSRMEEDSLPLPDMAQEELLERLDRVLCAVGRTLEGTLSRALRRSERPILRLQWTDDVGPVVCRWEKDERDKSFTLEEVVVARTGETSGMPPALAQVLPSVLAEGLLAGDISMPRFCRIRDAPPNTLFLRWIKPILEMRLAAKAECV